MCVRYKLCPRVSLFRLRAATKTSHYQRGETEQLSFTRESRPTPSAILVVVLHTGRVPHRQMVVVVLDAGIRGSGSSGDGSACKYSLEW